MVDAGWVVEEPSPNGSLLRRPDAGPRLTLVLEVAEVVQFVSDDGTADRCAVLLNADGDDAICDRIVGVEAASQEIAAEDTRQLVGPRLGNRIHLDAGGAPLCGVELVRDELELRDRVLAESRLPAGAELGANLLTVEIELEFSLLSAVPIRKRRGRVRRRSAASGS